MEIKYSENQNIIWWWDLETGDMRIEFKPNCPKEIMKMYEQLKKPIKRR